MTSPATTNAPEAVDDRVAGAGFESVLAGAALGGLSGLIPPVRDVATLAGALARKPGAVATRLGRASARLGRIAAGVADNPGQADRRFADRAWSGNPAFQRLALSYLTLCETAYAVLDDADLDWRTHQRLRMPLENLLAALAPTNTVLLNPAGWKECLDTGGASLISGFKNLLSDARSPAKLPTTVDRAEFVLGKTVAATAGSIIHRSDLCELIEYTPTTPEVDAVPVVMVPSPVNKFYLLDLEPDRSVIREELDRGRHVFVPSWSNPGVDDAEVGFDEYVADIVQTIEVVQQISGSPCVHLLGLCGGGVLAYLTAAYLAATDRQDSLATLTIAIAVIDYHRGPSTMAFLDANRVERAVRAARKRGFFDARSSARSFALMRPDDGIWSGVVNNYVLGRPPPAMALLAWAADQTNLTTTFGAQLLRATTRNAFVTPGALRVQDVPLDPAAITVDTYVLGASTDHISPWPDCYRTVHAVGGSVEFVLAQGGHAMVVARGPSVERTRHRTGPIAADADAWIAGSTEQPGSWWAHWNSWIEARTPERVRAPDKPGSEVYPPLDGAPGDYVGRVLT